MNHLKMLEAINELVDNDFCLDMSGKMLPNAKKYTQEETMQMAEIIDKVYLISHCTYCKSCGVKWEEE